MAWQAVQGARHKAPIPQFHKHFGDQATKGMWPTGLFRGRKALARRPRRPCARPAVWSRWLIFAADVPEKKKEKGFALGNRGMLEKDIVGNHGARRRKVPPPRFCLD